MVDKKNIYTVLKNDEVRKYCTELQIAQLSEICETISNGRFDDGKQLNTYYVVNIDEPYAEDISSTIQIGENNKSFSDIKPIVNSPSDLPSGFDGDYLLEQGIGREAWIRYDGKDYKDRG